MTKRDALTFDVIIVGAGPAGLCAALYAGRGLLKAVTIERGAPGGELLNTDLIEDYIGFESIKGWELAQKMTEHARKFGAEIVTDTVDRIHRHADGWFDVETARGDTYRSQAVILTAGGTPVKLGVPLLFNLYVNPTEEADKIAHDSWVVGPMLQMVGAFEESVKKYPLIRMGTPEPYKP